MKDLILLISVIGIIIYYAYYWLDNDNYAKNIPEYHNENGHRPFLKKEFHKLNPLPTFEERTYIWDNNDGIFILYL